MDNLTHRITVEWKHLRRASLTEERSGTSSALTALHSGKTPEQAANALIRKMYEKRQLLFDGIVINIDGESFRR